MILNSDLRFFFISLVCQTRIYAPLCSTGLQSPAPPPPRLAGFGSSSLTNLAFLFALILLSLSLPGTRPAPLDRHQTSRPCHFHPTRSCSLFVLLPLLLFLLLELVKFISFLCSASGKQARRRQNQPTDESCQPTDDASR